MKRSALLAAFLTAACQTTTPPATPPPPMQTAAESILIAADTPQRVARLPRTVIDYDRSLLNENERQVVAKV